MRFKVIRGYIEVPDDYLFGRGAGGGGGGVGPPGPQGPAGSSVPLSNTVWVDGGTSVLLADQNGSIGAPFATLTQGLNAMGGSTAFTVKLTPGDYSGEGDIALLSNPNTSIGIVCDSNWYGIGAITPELSATLPGIGGGDATQILHFTNCIWNTRPVTPAGTLRMDFCRVLGTSGTAALSAQNMSLNYNTITQRIVSSAAVVARNTAFMGTGAIITVSASAGSSVLAYGCLFDPAATISIVFTLGTGSFLVDGVTNFHWEAATESLVGGTKIIQEDLTV